MIDEGQAALAIIMDNPSVPAATPMLALIDRIIPADQDPGALDLGADQYVMAQLLADKALAEAVRHGLAQLDAIASQRFGKRFQDLAANQQDGLIAVHQEAAWFVALAELTAEGFYADSGNGGNRDARSWDMIGYQHRLPEGPNGPMPKADAEAGSET